jgi:Cytochrome c7 and related cytochrome c
VKYPGRTLAAWTSAVSCVVMAVFSLAAQAQLAPVAPQEVHDNVAPHPAPEQPIPYSHETHLALGLACASCHTNPDPGAQMGFPATSTCMSCHMAIAADKPSIMKLAGYARSGEAVPWVRVYQVLPGVIWSHRTHVSAGIGCGACHGDVAALETMAMTTGVVAMASCLGCHEARGANTVCETCHAWPAAP